ncbi:hypothetical protein B5F10_00970 [Anaerotruncus colihominis]|uniref:Uncharacterized protein n=2 Tax=Anaerotruncus colihominis TaxID=169435 RepID=B0PBG0_9FIRM|nr:hypothetical protein ANACOL_02111 [Anaerotruncus colihominis DSM 17241]OUO69094.1 hypothetical protein B5F55_02435 [Anaerotruncus colihominis]OUP71039.1 hypothetical protein B5F11_02935 [Anaerotruncus colihominis]OUP76435.1 hypothetical protein B5F10_00970 [Anaerotruncus colihominis]
MQMQKLQESIYHITVKSQAIFAIFKLLPLNFFIFLFIFLIFSVLLRNPQKIFFILTRKGYESVSVKQGF